MSGKQAVIETPMGTIVVELLPARAPNHVGYFMKLAREGAYAGTTFHRVIKYGLIQGGDPLSKDPAKTAQYGTGGMNMLRPEINQEPMTAGAMAAVLAPGLPNSAGAQFFICASDQPTIQGPVHGVWACGGGPRRRPADLSRARGCPMARRRSHRHQERDHQRHAAAGEGSPGGSHRRGTRRLSRHPRDDEGRDRAGVPDRQGAGNGAAVPAAGRRGCV